MIGYKPPRASSAVDRPRAPDDRPARGGQPGSAYASVARSLNLSAVLPISAARSGAAQAKLVVGGHDDPLEREADRVADAVVAGGASPSPGVSSDGAGGRVQRACASCEEETQQQQQAVRRAPDGPAMAATDGEYAPASVSSVVGGAAGEALPEGTRSFMEQRFAHDFRSVRVHTDATAAESARSIGAKAYSVGNSIVFGAGRYAPESGEGRRLLAHELTHVVQQSGGRRGADRAAAPDISAGGGGRVQSEEDEELQKKCKENVEKSIKELEETAAKEDKPQPEYIKKAIQLLRKKQSEGKIKCTTLAGLQHGKFKGDEIEMDARNPDGVNTTTVLHEGVHAERAAESPKTNKAYQSKEGKQVDTSTQEGKDLARWELYTEYWARRARYDYYNAGKPDKDKKPEEDIHRDVMNEEGLKKARADVRSFDPTFDPRTWKPK
jgi:hypothetical protein